MAEGRGFREINSADHHKGTHTNTHTLPYHIEVKVLLHPVSSSIELFKHFHDIESIQSVHDCRSLYAACKRNRAEIDYIL